MNYDELLYLDIDFLAEKFEEETGVSPDTVITRNEGVDAQAGVPFLKSKLHSQLTKQFTVSNHEMLKKTNKSLQKYPTETLTLTPGISPKNIWIEGNLSIGQWKKNKEEEVNKEDEKTNTFFEIKASNITYTLLPQNEYFLANLQTLEVITPALQRYINIPVKMLCKVLYALPDIETFVVTPYIIING